MKKIMMIMMLCASFVFAGYSAENSFEKDYMVKSATSLIMDVNKKVTYADAYTIAENVYDATMESDLSYSYVLGIMMTESRFNPNARSRCGAMGLMQVMPSTFTAISTQHGLNYSVSDGFDIEKNIRIGVLYLDRLLRKYGHLDLVAAGYNGGPRAANNYKAGNYSYVPKQTMNYVKAVRKNEKYFAIAWRVEL